MGGMSLEPTSTIKVGGQTRTVKAARRTGQDSKDTKKKVGGKGEMLLKASLKKTDDDEDWESAEEDAPAVRLEELLGNMKLDDDENKDSDEEEEKKESA